MSYNQITLAGKPKMTIENLISLQGPLAETLSQLGPNTIQHADEITNARRTNRELRNQWLWTADCAIYTVEDNQPVLYLTRGKDNPIFKNIQEAAGQLIHTHNYVPKKEDLETAINSEDTLKAKLSDLNLQDHNSEFSYFEFDTFYFKFDTRNYQENSNSAQRAVIERVFSEEGVKVLRDNGMKKARIYALTPNYVKEHAGEDSAIARACRLGSFDGGSLFGADGWGVDCSYSRYGRLRGVPRKIAEDTTQKFPAEQPEIGYAKAFDVILNTPEELNDERRTNFLNLITSPYRLY